MSEILAYGLMLWAFLIVVGTWVVTAAECGDVSHFGCPLAVPHRHGQRWVAILARYLVWAVLVLPAFGVYVAVLLLMALFQRADDA